MDYSPEFGAHISRDDQAPPELDTTTWSNPFESRLAAAMDDSANTPTTTTRRNINSHNNHRAPTTDDLPTLQSRTASRDDASNNNNTTITNPHLLPPANASQTSRDDLFLSYTRSNSNNNYNNHNTSGDKTNNNNNNNNEKLMNTTFDGTTPPPPPTTTTTANQEEENDENQIRQRIMASANEFALKHENDVHFNNNYTLPTANEPQILLPKQYHNPVQHDHHHDKDSTCGHPNDVDLSEIGSHFSDYSNLSYGTNATFLSVATFRKKFIGSRFHAPPFILMPYILTGYRMNYNTWWDCIKSIFEIHNESTSIHTHLLGFLIYVGLMVYRYNTILYLLWDSDPLLFWSYIIFYIGSGVCMLFSATFHTVCCMNEDMFRTWYSRDMIGVVGMIIAQYLHPMIISFYCDERGTGYVYAGVALVAGIMILLMQSMNYFLQPRWFAVRISSIMIYGAAAVVPFAHFGAAVGTPEQVDLLITTMIITLCIYAIGSLTWLFKLPERFPIFHGLLDLGTYSHAFWHLSIIIASLTMERGFMFALLQIVENRWCPAVPLQ